MKNKNKNKKYTNHKPNNNRILDTRPESPVITGVTLIGIQASDAIMTSIPAPAQPALPGAPIIDTGFESNYANNIRNSKSVSPRFSSIDASVFTSNITPKNMTFQDLEFKPGGIKYQNNGTTESVNDVTLVMNSAAMEARNALTISQFTELEFNNYKPITGSVIDPFVTFAHAADLNSSHVYAAVKRIKETQNVLAHYAKYDLPFNKQFNEFFTAFQQRRFISKVSKLLGELAQMPAFKTSIDTIEAFTTPVLTEQSYDGMLTYRSIKNQPTEKSNALIVENAGTKVHLLSKLALDPTLNEFFNLNHIYYVITEQIGKLPKLILGKKKASWSSSTPIIKQYMDYMMEIIDKITDLVSSTKIVFSHWIAALRKLGPSWIDTNLMLSWSPLSYFSANVIKHSNRDLSLAFCSSIHPNLEQNDNNTIGVKTPYFNNVSLPPIYTSNALLAFLDTKEGYEPIINLLTIGTPIKSQHFVGDVGTDDKKPSSQFDGYDSAWFSGKTFFEVKYAAVPYSMLDGAETGFMPINIIVIPMINDTAFTKINYINVTAPWLYSYLKALFLATTPVTKRSPHQTLSVEYNSAMRGWRTLAFPSVVTKMLTEAPKYFGIKPATSITII